jgi:hypothetical protein
MPNLADFLPSHFFWGVGYLLFGLVVLVFVVDLATDLWHWLHRCDWREEPESSAALDEVTSGTHWSAPRLPDSILRHRYFRRIKARSPTFGDPGSPRNGGR